MKIAVSSIAKNEVDNVEGFVKSCREADLVSVLDTGSADGTQKLLKKHKAFAGQTEIKPWHFGKARNKALDLLPNDIDVVVSIDLDERLQPGWRKALEAAWRPDTESLSYRYVAEWQDQKQTVPAVIAWRSKVFKRKGLIWYNPVHEIPLPKDKHAPSLVQCEGMVVYHYQRGTRDYSGLLTEWLKETPDYEDGYIQRGAEYLKSGKYLEAIKDFEKYLELSRGEQKKCGNPDCQRCRLIGGKRAYSHLDIARAKHKLGFPPMEITKHFLSAVAEAPDLREAWTYLADGWMSLGNYAAAYGTAMTALSIKDCDIHTQEMICWGNYPKDIADAAFAKLLAGLPQGGLQEKQFGKPVFRIGQSLSDNELEEYFKGLTSQVAGIAGNFIECGVCHGYSFTQIALALYQSGENRTLYGLDSWAKMHSGKEDYSLARDLGINEELANFEQGQASSKEVLERLESSGIPRQWIKKHVLLIKGYLAQTLLSLTGKFAFVHLDVDSYESYKTAMKILWPKVAKGGIVALDEYGDAWWPGAQKAVDEYLKDKKGQFQFQAVQVGGTGRWNLLKLK